MIKRKISFLLLVSLSLTVLSCKGQESEKVTVGLDYHFNNEYKKDKNGNPYRFHYTWEDKKDSGFSMWDSAFTSLGAETLSLASAPSKQKLSNIDIYIIVDPDTEKETEKPNFVGQKDIQVITDWVKAGGILVLMANDSSNAEFENFNKLAAQFGIKFNRDKKNPVIGKQFEMGKIMIPADHLIFKEVNKIYIKEFSSLELTSPAKAVLSNKDNDVAMAYAEIGKGLVFAVGDPWLYNEYSNQSRLSADYQNYKAGKALAEWLINQAKSK